MVYVSRPRLGDVCNVLAMAQPDRLTRQFRYGIQLAGAAWPQFLRPLVLELVSHRTVTPSAMTPPVEVPAIRSNNSHTGRLAPGYLPRRSKES